MTNKDVESFTLISQGLSGVPGPIKESFFKALGSLLGGLTSIPAAWLNQKAQAIHDRTEASSQIAMALAKAVSEQSLADPILVQAAVEVYIPDAIRKARNRVRIAKLAVDHASESIEAESPQGAPEDDWLNSFCRLAEDASSETLQDLFGRILAGEIARPGRFSVSTLRIISELDQEIARDFNLVWELSVGEAVDYTNELRRGDEFSRWGRLSEAGLMAPAHTTQYLPPFNPILSDTCIWGPFSAGEFHLLVYFRESANTQWNHIMFTRVGRELGSLLPEPDYERNFRKAADGIAKNGVTKIELWAKNGSCEVIWKSDV